MRRRRITRSNEITEFEQSPLRLFALSVVTLGNWPNGFFVASRITFVLSRVTSDSSSLRPPRVGLHPVAPAGSASREQPLIESSSPTLRRFHMRVGGLH